MFPSSALACSRYFALHASSFVNEKHRPACLLADELVGLSTAAGKMEMLLEQCKGGLSFDLSQADEHKRAVIHGHEVEQRMVPLTALDDFIVAYLGRDRTVQLVKMDTEGSEIDILRSGMQIFRS